MRYLFGILIFIVFCSIVFIMFKKITRQTNKFIRKEIRKEGYKEYKQYARDMQKKEIKMIRKKRKRAKWAKYQRKYGP